MGCCCGREDSVRETELDELKQKHTDKFSNPGLTKRRKCRDIPFLLLFILWWVGMAVIAVFAVQKGDPYRLIYGDDYQGNVCGRDNRNDTRIVEGLARRGEVPRDHTHNTNQYFLMTLSRDIDIFRIPRLCLNKCPQRTSTQELLCLYQFQSQANLTTDPTAAAREIAAGHCMFPYASISVFYRCIPEIASNISTTAIEQLQVRDYFEQFIATLYASGAVIGYSLLGALVVGFLWLLFMRFFAGVTVWFTIWAALFAIAALAGILWLSADELEQTYNEQPPSLQLRTDEINFLGLRYLSYVVLGVGGIILLIIIFNGKNIQLTITLCQEASKAFGSMPWIVAFPLVPFIFIAGLTIYFGFVGAFLATAADIVYTDNGEYDGFDYDATLRGMAIIHIFGYLWTANLILALLQTTVAGSIADWYYSYSGKKLKPFVVTRAFFRTLVWNLGSLAVGSFLLALVELARLILAFIQARLRGKENRLARGLLTCLQCCLACFQRFIEFLNKHAYIMIAIYGYNFCTSARRGFSIIVTNPIQLATIHGITELVMFLGKVFIVGITTGGAFVYIRYNDVTRLWWIPLILIGIASFLIACCFMLIYDMAVSSLLFCFLEDSARNPAEDRHMSKKLEAFVNDSGGIDCCCCC